MQSHTLMNYRFDIPFVQPESKDNGIFVGGPSCFVQSCEYVGNYFTSRAVRSWRVLAEVYRRLCMRCVEICNDRVYYNCSVQTVSVLSG